MYMLYFFFIIYHSAMQNITHQLTLTNGTRRGVINFSLGGGRSLWSYMYEYYFDIIIENGGILVVAAGNKYVLFKSKVNVKKKNARDAKNHHDVVFVQSRNELYFIFMLVPV